MAMAPVLHMVGGNGDTSYAANSQYQEKAIAKAKAVLEQAMVDLCSANLPEKMVVADLGCSSGPNAFLIIAEIVHMARMICGQRGRDTMEIQFILNDLPGNDFNSIFKALPSFQRKLEQEGDKGKKLVQFYVTAVPASFYGRLLPKNSIHLLHSSNSLHWLSQVPKGLESVTGIPLNRGNIYVSDTSPPNVFKCYLEQYQIDFSLFLKLRAEEIIPGGAMVLTIQGRATGDPSCDATSCILKLLAEALNDMVKQGLVEEAKVDRFNLPFFTPSVEELKASIQSEGSFILNQLQTFELNRDQMADDCDKYHVVNNLESGQNSARAIRAVIEPMLSSHFGEEIMDDLFSRFAKIVAVNFCKEKTKHVNLCFYVIRKG